MKRVTQIDSHVTISFKNSNQGRPCTQYIQCTRYTTKLYKITLKLLDFVTAISDDKADHHIFQFFRPTTLCMCLIILIKSTN